MHAEPRADAQAYEQSAEQADRQTKRTYGQTASIGAQTTKRT